MKTINKKYSNSYTKNLLRVIHIDFNVIEINEGDEMLHINFGDSKRMYADLNTLTNFLTVDIRLLFTTENYFKIAIPYELLKVIRYDEIKNKTYFVS